MEFVVIGAGPIGLEMALAARDAGHACTVFEAAEVGHHVRRWGHVTLFTPWRMNTTARGRRALGDPPLLDDDQVCPTGREFQEQYLAPLAEQLDVHCGHRVVGVSRPWKRKGDELGSRSRTASPFELLIEGPDGEQIVRADVVVDCTGVFGDPAPLGPGGSPVPGERGNPSVSYGPVPVGDLAGRRVLLVGDGASATTVLHDLLELSPPAAIHWVTAGSAVPGFVSPPDDPLPQRSELVRTARRALEVVTHHPGASIDRLDGGHVQFADGTSLEVDRVLACTGFRPNHTLSRELQVHVCWGSEGPMKLAAALLAARGDGPADCLAGGPSGADLLKNPEPNFFILGNKSYGRRSDFLLGVGHQQVHDVFELLGSAR